VLRESVCLWLSACHIKFDCGAWTVSTLGAITHKVSLQVLVIPQFSSVRVEHQAGDAPRGAPLRCYSPDSTCEQDFCNSSGLKRRRHGLARDISFRLCGPGFLIATVQKEITEIPGSKLANREQIIPYSALRQDTLEHTERSWIVYVDPPSTSVLQNGAAATKTNRSY